GAGPPVGDVRTVFTVSPRALPEALAAVAAARPTHVIVRPPSLDELFLEHYSNGVAGDSDSAATHEVAS
ncbi:MAG: hypothetical protein Q4G46_04850, partial [Propionibacteriaceae bacterium]|nr:hypothetical protein [Propionibacteriaceae bacterium]